MFAHKPEHVESYLGAVEGSFSLIKELLDTQKLKTHLKGRPSGSGFKRLT